MWISPVASYFDSTSNHNITRVNFLSTLVASYFDSTSNHNKHPTTLFLTTLLHILILHQTTTAAMRVSEITSCFIFWFYIKPQLLKRWGLTVLSCFIFWFYIKPQLRPCGCISSCVASYFDSTSNHNDEYPGRVKIRVASYFDSTSNHNTIIWIVYFIKLLHILILHQTTTCTI